MRPPGLAPHASSSSMPPPALRATAYRILTWRVTARAAVGPVARRALCPLSPPPTALANPARRASTPASASTSAAATFLAATEAATARLAELTGGYAPAATSAGVPPPAPGDAYSLTGGVGAGKSAWARGFVRGAAGDPGLPVPSPTYLLHNVYDEVDGPAIHHFDLYRLAGAGGDRVSGSGGGSGGGCGLDGECGAPAAAGLDGFDIDRVGLADALADGVSLIEWADRLGPGGPAAAAAVVGGGGGGASTPSPSVIHVAIDALSPAQAAGLAARCLAGDPTGDAGEGGDDEGSGGTDLYTDARPRAVRLRAVSDGGGSSSSSSARGAARVAAVAAAVRAGAGGPGLALVEEEEEGA